MTNFFNDAGDEMTIDLYNKICQSDMDFDNKINYQPRVYVLTSNSYGKGSYLGHYYHRSEACEAKFRMSKDFSKLVYYSKYTYKTPIPEIIPGYWVTLNNNATFNPFQFYRDKYEFQINWNLIITFSKIYEPFFKDGYKLKKDKVYQVIEINEVHGQLIYLIEDRETERQGFVYPENVSFHSKNHGWKLKYPRKINYVYKHEPIKT